MEDTAQHGAVGSDGRIRKRERATEVKQKVSHLRDRRPRDRVTMTMTPGTIYSSVSLVVYPCGASTAQGKLTSHRAENPECHADRWIYATQSAEARGGSGDNDESGAV